jgi:hypothetical protein
MEPAAEGTDQEAVAAPVIRFGGSSAGIDAQIDAVFENDRCEVSVPGSEIEPRRGRWTSPRSRLGGAQESAK